MWWQVLVVIALFVWHEAEEYRVLLPWLETNRDQLPRVFHRLRLSPRAFVVIAVEELALLLLIAVVLPGWWFTAATIAYGVHLLAHCGQWVYTARKGMALRLWSAPLQLPILALVLWHMPHPDPLMLTAGSALMVVVLVVNLAIMHVATHHLGTHPDGS